MEKASSWISPRNVITVSVRSVVTCCNHVIHNIDARSIPLYPSFGQCPGSWFIPEARRHIISATSTTSPQAQSPRSILRSHTLTNLCPTFANGLLWCRNPPRRRCFFPLTLSLLAFSLLEALLTKGFERGQQMASICRAQNCWRELMLFPHIIHHQMHQAPNP